MPSRLPDCPVETTLTLIRDKWTTLVLRDLMSGTKRFGELRRSVGNVPQKVLTDCLREMERDGFVTAHRLRRGTSPCRVCAHAARKKS